MKNRTWIIPSVQVSFHFAVCSGLFPVWKTICDDVPSVQPSIRFGKPYVKLLPSFSFYFGKPYVKLLPSGSFYFGKPYVKLLPSGSFYFGKPYVKLLPPGSFYFGKPYVALFLSVLSTLENYMWSFCPQGLSTLENHVWCFALCSGHLPFWKAICDALPLVQATFHFGKPSVTLFLCLDHFPLWKTISDDLSLFRPFSILENHMWCFAFCSGHFYFGKPYVTLYPLFRPLSTLENRLWLLVTASSVMMCPQDLSTYPMLFLEKVSFLTLTDHAFRSVEDRQRHHQTDKVVWSSRGDLHKGDQLSSAHTEYKLNSVPRILSISLTQFRVYSVCAEAGRVVSSWIMAKSIFLSYKTLILKHIVCQKVHNSKSELTKFSRLCTFDLIL